MSPKTKRRIVASISAGIVTGISTFIGIITQMMNDGKTQISDIAELAWLVLFLSILGSAAKDIHSRINEHKHTSSELEEDEHTRL